MHRDTANLTRLRLRLRAQHEGKTLQQVQREELRAAHGGSTRPLTGIGLG